jgi:uncharacterized membrane protein (DUF4010 family)
MNTPLDFDLLLGFVISAGLGALVGLLRQWTDWAEDHRGEIKFGGARTFALWAMLGCAGAAAASRFGPAIVVVLVLLVGSHHMVVTARLSHRRAGATSFAAILLTFMVGVFVEWDERNAAVVIAAVTAIVVGVKRPVHDWTRAFTREDIAAALQFLAVTGVILPLVPNQDFGPYGAFNPYSTWLMVVLISGVGFAGYVVMRWLGQRAGILLASLFGGIASSTATTLAFSRQSHEQPPVSTQCAVGVVIACAVMYARVVVIVGFLNRPLAMALIVPFLIIASPAVLFAGGLWLWHRRDRADVSLPEVKNPLTLGTALKFGAAYAVIAFLVKIVRQSGWEAGMLPLSFVSGLTNMDAIALSLARGGGQGGGAIHGMAAGIVVATVGNTLLKGGFALVLGTPVMRRWVAVGLGWMAVSGIAIPVLGLV